MHYLLDFAGTCIPSADFRFVFLEPSFYVSRDARLDTFIGASQEVDEVGHSLVLPYGNTYGFLSTAAGLGFEPRYRDPKSRVLPLDDPAAVERNSRAISYRKTIPQMHREFNTVRLVSQPRELT